MIVKLLTSDISNGIDILNNSRHRIKENEVVEFKVLTLLNPDVAFPCITIGDVPLKLMYLDFVDGYYVYTSKLSNQFYKNQFFLNFFGESEIVISSGAGVDLVSIFEIVARKANALLAKDILTFLSDRVDDLTNLCFSRSRITSSVENKDATSLITKLSLVSNIIEQFNKDSSYFAIQHSFKLDNVMTEKEQARSVGPDSIHFVINNVDLLTRTSPKYSNIKSYDNFYHLEILPSEELVESTDTLENQLIHCFFDKIKQFLMATKEEFTKGKSKQNYMDSDFFSFDDILSGFGTEILKNKLLEVERLISDVNCLKLKFTKIIPAKRVFQFKLKFTSYFKSTPHYRRAFEMMEQWSRAPSPKIGGDNLLSGIKNLSKLYEYSSLLMLNDSIVKMLNIELESRTFLDYRTDTTVVEVERPNHKINNNFHYSNQNTTATLMYEPLIYAHNKDSAFNSLVNISGRKNKKPELLHAFCPDFCLEINNVNWETPVFVIFDAKYTNKGNVEERGLPDIMEKYLFGLSYLKKNGMFGSSAVKAVIALFPHDTNGIRVSNTAPQYCLTGPHPVLPHLSGQIFRPGRSNQIDLIISNLFKVIYSESNNKEFTLL
jgi:hypothetical protein